MRRKNRSASPSLTLLALTLAAAASAENAPESYSPFIGAQHATRVFFGDTHLHTENSPDAFLFGARLDPDTAYRFAQGERVKSTHGVPVRLIRPLDFLVVADHAEYLGLMPRLFGGDSDVLATEYGREVYDLAKSEDGGYFKAAMLLIQDLSLNLEKIKLPELELGIWQRVAQTADRYDAPGRFTAFIGYEWTSLIEGNNLHRVVIYKDDAFTAARIAPFSSFDSPDPEALWRSMAEYERLLGGEVLAIPHNGNLSNGMMFQTQRLDGRAFDRAYAEKRRRWEPLYEVTQIKGDGETHPRISPNDEFADYESWDFANLNGSAPKQDWMLPYEYGRSALKLGLELESELGVNPYQFGLIGSTDSHTGLATAREDNFFGKHSGMEPSPRRVTSALAKINDAEVLGWQQVASGLAAVWASENTRAALFAAMKRRETYATTGSRLRVRVFAGWDFEHADLARPDFAAHGYAKGVPMGGELEDAAPGASPTFLVRALRDPEGANLDRVQIIKGRLDAAGVLHEQIHDVALSDGRTRGADGSIPPVASTVDVAAATYTNTIGASQLDAWWRDDGFDPNERAFYYVRVIEIPTPRWTAYDAARFGIAVPEASRMTTQERAYTSPIWFTPAN